ncbi:unnamed protein product [Blepharisma stoltei]|uniref:Uncharacterized protein n=1 Tax=Blepharisma stoltei TaxID=1481888 RepID=A0AAU9IDR1_9CILI|nr:unnamed protein product [Blepharisma stoltei]
MNEQKWNERFEEMMQKKRKTQEKLKMLQAQKLLDEMKEVTGVPKINEVSRKVANELAKIEAEKAANSESNNYKEATPISNASKGDNQAQPNKSFSRSAAKYLKNDDLESKRLPPPTEIVFPPKKSDTLPSKEFKDLQETYIRAQTLHCQQQNSQALSPRCHIDLQSGQASEQYINLRAPKNGKVSNTMGVSQAETLRRDFLQTEENSKEKLDTYMKNIKWVQKREEKLKEQRWDRQVSEITPCTFKPALTKSQSLRNSFSGPHEDKDNNYLDMHYRRKNLQESLEKQEVKLKKAESVRSAEADSVEESQVQSLKDKPFTYSALAPMGSRVKYKEGFNVKKFTNTAKPMVSYKRLE